MNQPDRNLEKLQRWMEEYILDRQWGVEEPGKYVQKEAQADVSDEVEPQSGQIRLWPAGDTGGGTGGGTGQGPLYGLIWSEGYDVWRVMPFSPFATPATPEELMVREQPPVRVVQGWNPRCVPGQVVRQTWCVDRLSAELEARVEQWWMQVQAGSGEIDGEDVGPPVIHPMDPRLEYMDSERSRVDLFLGEAPATYQAEEPRIAAERPEDEDGYVT